MTKNVSREEVCRLGREAARAVRLLDEGRWWELLLGEGVPQPQVKPISVRQLFEEDEEEVGGVEERRSQPVDKVKLASLLGNEAAAQIGARDATEETSTTPVPVDRKWGGHTPFSGLRLTFDGETPVSSRAPVSAGERRAAETAAGERRAVEATVAAREQRAAVEAIRLLDATSNKRPSKRKKKKRSQASR